MSHRRPSSCVALRAAAFFAAVLPFLAAQDPAGGAAAAPDAKVFGPFTIVRDCERLPVLAQGSTGTCWSFATTSFLETELKRINKQEVDLSEIWWARCATIEKARRYVEANGQATFGEGGLGHDLTELVQLYGAVPQSAYTGLREGQKNHSHGEMFKVLTGALDSAIGKTKAAEPAATGGAQSKPASRPAKRKASASLMRAVEAITDSYLGAPPTTFEVDGKTYDPKSYAAEFLKIAPGDYIEVMSFGTEPLGGKAKLVVPDNWLQNDQYENIPVDQFMAGLNAAIEAGYSIALDTDVSESGFNPLKGEATLETKPKKNATPEEEAAVKLLCDAEKNPTLITQEMRDAAFKSGETTDDHLMHVVGVAKHADGRRFYLTKNSWGAKGPGSGPYGGYIFISEAYVRVKALSIMVHKDALKNKT
jgi:bleomycin hydrolase